MCMFIKKQEDEKKKCEKGETESMYVWDLMI